MNFDQIKTSRYLIGTRVSVAEGYPSYLLDKKATIVGYYQRWESDYSNYETDLILLFDEPISGGFNEGTMALVIQDAYNLDVIK